MSLNGTVTCQKEECGFPPTLQYSTVLGNIYTVGSNVCYECQESYINTGGNINCSTCTGTGNWSAVNIQCEPPYVCDDNWILYAGHCYFKHDTEKTWRDARSYCRNKGGYLLSIETEAENTFMAKTFPSGGFWLGGNDIKQGGVYVWDSGNDFIFKNWDDDQPSDTSASVDCIRSRGTWKWHDRDCTFPFKSICEKEATITTNSGLAATPITSTSSVSSTTTTAISSTTASVNIQCDSSWLKYGGHCYFENTEENNWEDARTFCKGNSGYLLEIETAAENTFLNGAFLGEKYWIGGQDFALDGVYVWDSGNALIFENWEDGQPDNKDDDEDCIRSTLNWKWRDKDCNMLHKSICEIEPTKDTGHTTSTTTTVTTSTTSYRTTTTPIPTCPSDWTLYMNHCYYQDYVDRSWYNAQSNCNNQGGYMLSIETTEEFEFIKRAFHAGVSWLGGTDAAMEGVWVWESGAHLTFTQWEPDQPDNTNNGDCMAMNKAWNTWQWDDQGCANKYKSVCEIDLSRALGTS